jgi:tetratricopeptide (TPR) repeat protein
MRPSFLLITVCAALALALASTAARAESAEDLIQKGDVFYAKLQATEALEFYLPAEKLDPTNVKLLVRIAREYRHLMSDATKAAEKLQLGNTAVDYALRAVTLAPEDPEAQLALAISYGKMMPLEETKQQIATQRLIKSAVDKAITLDPTNDLAWHVLGRWYLALADVGTLKRALARVAYGKLPPAKHEDAVCCFEKAIALNPNRLMHCIELGRTYAEMGREAEARKFVIRGLAMPETEKEDQENKAREQILKTATLSAVQWVRVNVSAKLRGHHGGKAALHGETRQRAHRHLAKSTPPVMHRGCVEIARAAQGFFAQELANERWLGIHVEAVQRRAEDHFAPLVNRWRQPALGQQTQQMLVAETPQLPPRIQFGEESENLLIQKRISHLHGGMHRYAVSFCLEQVPGERHTGRDPDAAVERMPAFGARKWDLQIGPWVCVLAHFVHRLGIKAELGQTEQAVGVNPRVRAADLPRCRAGTRVDIALHFHRR